MSGVIVCRLRHVQYEADACAEKQPDDEKNEGSHSLTFVSFLFQTAPSGRREAGGVGDERPAGRPYLSRHQNYGSKWLAVVAPSRVIVEFSVTRMVEPLGKS